MSAAERGDLGDVAELREGRYIVTIPAEVLEAAELNADDYRDRQEEAYWQKFCDPCGSSPCTWDGQPDGFHTEAEPPDREAGQ